MRDLRINPTGHEIDLNVIIENGDKYANVYHNLTNDDGVLSLNSKEAEKIGNWFLSLSKHIKVVSKKKSEKVEEDV